MNILRSGINRFKEWVHKKLYALRVVDVEEYFYQRDHDLPSTWGAQVLVSCESRLLGNLVRREWMVKVNYPHLLAQDKEISESGMQALIAYFTKKEDKVVSITLLDDSGEMTYYLLNHVLQTN